MLKESALTAFLVVLSLPALCAQPEAKKIPYPNMNDSVVIPAGSSIRYSGLKMRSGALAVTFRGRLVVTGTYYYGDNDFNDSGDETPAKYRFEAEAYIRPDAETVARLPHFAIRNGGRYTILIDNPDDFANAAISRAAQRRVRCRHCGVATGHIAIRADQFSASIQCDKPHYEVRFLSVYKPARTVIVPGRAIVC